MWKFHRHRPTHQNQELQKQVFLNHDTTFTYKSVHDWIGFTKSIDHVIRETKTHNNLQNPITLRGQHQTKIALFKSLATHAANLSLSHSVHAINSKIPTLKSLTREFCFQAAICQKMFLSSSFIGSLKKWCTAPTLKNNKAQHRNQLNFSLSIYFFFSLSFVLNLKRPKI